MALADVLDHFTGTLAAVSQTNLNAWNSVQQNSVQMGNIIYGTTVQVNASTISDAKQFASERTAIHVPVAAGEAPLAK